MGRRRKGEPPPYLEHKTSGRAYSTVNGDCFYFGAYGSRESREEYESFRRHWLSLNKPLVVAAGAFPGTIKAFVGDYLADVKAGLSDIEYLDVTRNLGTLNDHFGELPPDGFRPAMLKELRKVWIGRGHHRHTINKAVGRVRRFFRWLVADDKANAETLGALRAVPDIPKGTGKENPPIEPVPLRAYFRTVRQLGRHVRALCRLQFYAGCRPGEALRICGLEIIRSGAVRIGNRELPVPPGVWLFMPQQHKNKKRGKTAVYLLGPRAQAVLTPFLRADLDEPLFQPQEARAEWEAEKRAARLARLRAKGRKGWKIQPSQLCRKKKAPRRSAGVRYSIASYNRAIERAAVRAGVADPTVKGQKNLRPAWTPLQLRHRFAVRMERATDLLTASALLSHSRPETSLLYLQAKIREAAPVAAKLG